MTEFIIRLFVKDYKDTQDPDVRLRYGSVAGATGIVCNVFLFIAKLIIGTISRSVSITADAVNNLSDAASSILTLLGFRSRQIKNIHMVMQEWSICREWLCRRLYL